MVVWCLAPCQVKPRYIQSKPFSKGICVIHSCLCQANSKLTAVAKLSVCMFAQPCPSISVGDALLGQSNVCTLTKSQPKDYFVLHKNVLVSSTVKKENVWPSTQFTDKNVWTFSYHEPNRKNYLAFTLFCLFVCFNKTRNFPHQFLF